MMPISKNPNAWHSMDVASVLSSVGVSASGLTSEEARKRLAANGPNELRKVKQIGIFRILAEQFKSLIVLVLIIAGVVSACFGEWVDAIAITAIVLLNAAIGFYQEFSAAKSIEALKTLTAPNAKLLRDGQMTTVPSRDVVDGDVLELEAGDLVAADSRLLETASLKCVEAALTGESEAVAKRPEKLEEYDVQLGDRANMVFAGTIVASGTGLAVVVSTGMETEIGRIAEMIKEADANSSTPLQRKLDSVGHILVWVSLGIVAVLFGIGLMQGTPILELFMTSVSLAVAAVPEGLPAVVTVALALGVQRMARQRALVRRLAAVETLGSASVICTDKTGTLTVGEMTARAVYVDGKLYDVTGEGYGPEGEILLNGQKPDANNAASLHELAICQLGCNHAHLVKEDSIWKTIGDPTEGALLSVGKKAGGDREQIEAEWPMQLEFPFDSDRKRSSSLRKLPDGSFRALVNGAPGPLLSCCTQIYTAEGAVPLTEALRAAILQQTSAMANRALRVLASATRVLDQVADDLSADKIERELTFVGLSAMYDPPRHEVKSAIALCRKAGIRVVMITGDHPQTASAIATELSIASDAKTLTGAELDKLSDEELHSKAKSTAVYARVTAAHKLRVIRALQTGGEIVAMTGDGVNDAPAVQGSDIGVAMGRTGTEVTKQAADIIITDDNFATIVAAVEQGRGVYSNIRKTLQYLLAGNTAEIVLMTVCVAAGLPAPLLPVHLLWINLVTDGLPALCLAVDPVDPAVMDHPPRPASDRILNTGFLCTMLATGVLTAGVAIAVYVYFIYFLKDGTIAMARDAAFTVLVFSELLRSFGARSEFKPFWRIKPLFSFSLVSVVVVSLVLQLWSQYNPMLRELLKTSGMPLTTWLTLLGIGTIPFFTLEIVKFFRNIVYARTSQIITTKQDASTSKTNLQS